MDCYRKILKLFFLVFVILTLSAPLQAQLAEYEIKAAFLFNFAKFVTWPEEPPGNMMLCIIGNDPFGQALDVLADKEVHGKPLQIRQIASAEAGAGCHILFVSRSETSQLEKLFAFFNQESGLLTVSDISNFAARGGMIELLLEGNKVRFAINVSAARNAGLGMSSKLLQLATRIEGVNR